MPESNERQPAKKPDDAAKSGQQELTEKDLDKAVGGLLGVDGESTDDKHKG